MGHEHKALVKEELLERPDDVDELLVLEEEHVSALHLGDINDVVKRGSLLLL